MCNGIGYTGYGSFVSIIVDAVDERCIGKGDQVVGRKRGAAWVVRELFD